MARLKHVWAHFGQYWAQLRPYWNRLVAILTPNWAVLRHTGANVDPPGDMLEATWSNLGELEPPRGQLGACLSHIGPNLDPTWAQLGPTWANLQLTWAQFGATRYVCSLILRALALSHPPYSFFPLPFPSFPFILLHSPGPAECAERLNAASPSAGSAVLDERLQIQIRIRARSG